MDIRHIVVFLLGGPGSGKGTQSALIHYHYKFIHLSAGDLLREYRQTPGTPFGYTIYTCIKEGKIVPSYITVKLLENAMNKSGAKFFLIDGFPRNHENLSAWYTHMLGKVDVAFLLYLRCSQQTMIYRLLKRAYTSGRIDDNIESIKKRLDTYEMETKKVIEEFTKRGKTVEIDGERAPELVFGDLKPHFDKLIQ